MDPTQTALLPTHSPDIAGGSRVSREQGFLSESPEYFELWRQMTFGTPANVSTPTGKRIQAAINAMEGKDFAERILFIMQATEAECPGLWLAISQAGKNRLDAQDFAFREECREAMERIETMQSDTMKAAAKKQLDNRIHSHFTRPMGR